MINLPLQYKDQLRYVYEQHLQPFVEDINPIPDQAVVRPQVLLVFLLSYFNQQILSDRVASVTSASITLSETRRQKLTESVRTEDGRVLTKDELELKAAQLELDIEAGKTRIKAFHKNPPNNFENYVLLRELLIMTENKQRIWMVVMQLLNETQSPLRESTSQQETSNEPRPPAIQQRPEDVLINNMRNPMMNGMQNGVANLTNTTFIQQGYSDFMRNKDGRCLTQDEVKMKAAQLDRDIEADRRLMRNMVMSINSKEAIWGKVAQILDQTGSYPEHSAQGQQSGQGSADNHVQVPRCVLFR